MVNDNAAPDLDLTAVGRPLVLTGTAARNAFEALVMQYLGMIGRPVAKIVLTIEPRHDIVGTVHEYVAMRNGKGVRTISRRFVVHAPAIQPVDAGQ